MSHLLRRLARLTRAHLSDFLESRLAGYRDTAPGQADPASWQKTEDGGRFSTRASETPLPSDLPYDPELVGYYRALDLPFGVPMTQVSKRWKAYLKKCHPDRYANEPDKQADATRLTQELTQAHEKIKRAWERYRS